MPRPAARVIAHRGRHDTRRENTLAAFQGALRTGADAAELDVRLTRDGVPVLAHDAVQWRGPRPHVVGRSAIRAVPFLTPLEQVLGAVPPDVSGTPIVLDVKRAEQLGDVATFCLDQTAERSGNAAAIALWCRDAARLSSLPSRAAFGELALLPDRDGLRTPLSYLDAALDCGSSAVSLHPEVLTAALIDAAHDRGLRAYAWIQSRDAHDAAVAMGVDGLITDWVDAARRAADKPSR